jgi:hypothetical protein
MSERLMTPRSGPFSLTQTIRETCISPVRSLSSSAFRMPGAHRTIAFVWDSGCRSCLPLPDPTPVSFKTILGLRAMIDKMGKSGI